MTVKFIKGEEVKENIKTGVVIVGAFATWCGPCKMLAPFLEEIAGEGTKVVKVDVDKSKEWAKEQGISGIPSTFVYRDGELKQSFSGFVPKETLMQAAKNA